MNLLELPDEIIHSIFRYVANSPSFIGPCICHQLRPLSKQWQHEIDTKRRTLWELAVSDLSCDYYKSDDNDKINNRNATNTRADRSAPTRRTSKRLRPATPKERYIHSYNLLMSRNESAILELQEHTFYLSAVTATKKHKITTVIERLAMVVC